MQTVIAAIVIEPDIVTAITHLVHAVWMHLPAITTAVRAVVAAISVTTAICRVVRRHQDRTK
jgi:hypothetical protein